MPSAAAISIASSAISIVTGRRERSWSRIGSCVR
jgi:hypothetical protein